MMIYSGDIVDPPRIFFYTYYFSTESTHRAVLVCSGEEVARIIRLYPVHCSAASLKDRKESATFNINIEINHNINARDVF
jgi:hypothetical protein